MEIGWQVIEKIDLIHSTAVRNYSLIDKGRAARCLQASIQTSEQ